MVFPLSLFRKVSTTPSIGFDVVRLDLGNADDVNALTSLLHAYNREIGTPPGFDESKYLASVMKRMREPERWFFLARSPAKEPAGFSYFKIDREECTGWGYVLEFFVRPEHRLKGLGRHLLRRSCCVLAGAGVRKVWLTSNPGARRFWQACGFVSTGSIHGNSQEILVRTLSPRTDSDP
jgi:GNAT superfamily N-acetyltransferase